MNAVSAWRSVCRADDEPNPDPRIRLPLHVHFEQPRSLLDDLLVRCDDTETAALLDIEVSKIECQQMELTVIDDEILRVIANQIVGRARNGNPRSEQPRLQVAQPFFRRRDWCTQSRHALAPRDSRH